MVNARQKGKSGEYEVMHLLQEVCDVIFGEFRVVAPRLRRNAMAYADGGEDIVGLPWYSIEVKRCEKLELGKWWAQTLLQAASKPVGADEIALWDPMPDYCISRGYKDDFAAVKLAAYRSGVKMAADMEAVAKASIPKPQHVTLANAPVGAPSRVPLLFYRQTKSRWRVLTFGLLANWAPVGTAPVRLKMPVEVSVEPWLQWFRSDLRLRLLSIYPEPPATPG